MKALSISTCVIAATLYSFLKNYCIFLKECLHEIPLLYLIANSFLHVNKRVYSVVSTSHSSYMAATLPCTS